MKISEKYDAYLKSTDTENVLFIIESLTRDNISDPEKWFEGLSHFEFILHHFDLTDVNYLKRAIELFELLTYDGADFKASVYLEEEDYAFFIRKVSELSERFGVYYPEAYIENGIQHVVCRRGYRDAEKTNEQFSKAKIAGLEIAGAITNYYNYIGLLKDTDKETAKKNLEQLAAQGNHWGLIYSCYLKIWTDEWETILDDAAPLQNHPDDKIRKHYLQIAQGYYRRAQNTEKQREILEETIEKYNSSYARFILADIKIAEAGPDASISEELQELQNAFEYGIIDAAVSLALHLLPKHQEPSKEEFSASLKWFEYAWKYGSDYAGYRLAYLYLYNPLLENIPTGLSLMEEAAKGSSIDAKIELAELYLEGKVTEPNEIKALQLFTEMHEDGIAYASYRLGNFAEYGVNAQATEFDLNKAFEYYKIAADKNLPQALYQVGRYLKYGYNEIAPDVEASLPYLQKAAEYDNAQALTEMGLIEETKETPDYAKAFEYFDKAAAIGYPYANYLKGLYLENDYHQSGERDEQTAFECYNYAAQYNDVNALYETGRCYKYGIGIDENPDMAIHYLQQAADANHAKALTELALCYESGYGVAEDRQKAVDLMTQAAEMGYFYAEYVVGRYYLHGFVEQDSQKGLQWLNKVAETGYPYALLELGDYYFYDYDRLDTYDKAFPYYEQAAQQNVLTEGYGMCFEFGIGTEENLSRAYTEYLKAAEYGNVAAKFRLGRAYYFGIGTEKDEATAFRWFNEAAQQGNIYAQYYAGIQLLEGQGTVPNPQQAVSYFTDASEAGYADAQYSLANCYLMGEGVDENEAQAVYWFEKAAENGHEEAIKLTKKKRR